MLRTRDREDSPRNPRRAVPSPPSVEDDNFDRSVPEAGLDRRPATPRARRAATALIVIAALVTVGTLLAPSRVLAPPSQVDSQSFDQLIRRGLTPAEAVSVQLDAEKALRETADRRRGIVAGIFSGLLILVGAWVAYGNMRIAQGNLALLATGQANATRQLDLATSELVSTRFKDAIDQLGSGSMAVRLGGVYTMISLGSDYPRLGRDVYEIVSAFARVRSQERVPDEVDLPADLMAAIAHLARREGTQEESPVDLRGADLSNVDLRGAHLRGARLDRANLAGALLDRADLRDASMTDCCLYGASAGRADFSGANLTGSDLEALNIVVLMSPADFTKASLYGTLLRNANLSQATMGGANLYSCNAAGADCSRADLSGANLTSADLSGANLVGANLAGSSLQTSVLVGANLRGADLSRTNLSGTDLSGADLREATVEGVEWDGARQSDNTLWPEGEGLPPQNVEQNDATADAGSAQAPRKVLGDTTPRQALEDHVVARTNRYLLMEFERERSLAGAMAATVHAMIPSFRSVSEADPDDALSDFALTRKTVDGKEQVSMKLNQFTATVLRDALRFAAGRDIGWLTSRLRSPVAFAPADDALDATRSGPSPETPNA